MNTLIDVFRSLDGRRGEFIVYDDGYRVRRHSYTDVTRAARGFAAGLAAAGLRQGDKILLWSENRPEWIVAYWGAVISGVIVVPIDFRSSAEFVARVRDIVDGRIIFSGDDHAYAASPQLANVAQASEGGRLPFETRPLAGVDWAADGPMPAVSVDRDDVAQIV